MINETLFWFRRDLRLSDNAGLYSALKESSAVQPIFIFDTEILKSLPPTDCRMAFLHDRISVLKKELREIGSDLQVFHGEPEEIFKSLLKERKIAAVYANHDYEPSAIKRDLKVKKICESLGAEFKTFKDQVIFEKEEILSDARKVYTVYTPYKKKWLAGLSPFYLKSYPVEKYRKNFRKTKSSALISLKDLGFQKTEVVYPDATISAKLLKDYAKTRDFPAVHGTSHLGLHLRFGTMSVRDLARKAKEHSPVWLSELVWREFFMQILFHFPHVEKKSFREIYENVEWRNKKSEFERWCEGKTGYPMVDAGMRELNATGFMHNRVRMVTASFLTKHLLMHWYQGERYFASKLLDYDLAANNGNWQWAAGTGCDAAPYFRIFNPEAQMQRFDPAAEYVKKWVPEWQTSSYPQPMVEHREARERALQAFKKALKKEDK